MNTTPTTSTHPDPDRAGLIEILMIRFDRATPAQQREIVERAMLRDVWHLEAALTHVLDRVTITEES